MKYPILLQRTINCILATVASNWRKSGRSLWLSIAAVAAVRDPGEGETHGQRNKKYTLSRVNHVLHLLARNNLRWQYKTGGWCHRRRSLGCHSRQIYKRSDSTLNSEYIQTSSFFMSTRIFTRSFTTYNALRYQTSKILSSSMSEEAKPIICMCFLSVWLKWRCRWWWIAWVIHYFVSIFLLTKVLTIFSRPEDIPVQQI